MCLLFVYEDGEAESPCEIRPGLARGAARGSPGGRYGGPGSHDGERITNNLARKRRPPRGITEGGGTVLTAWWPRERGGQRINTIIGAIIVIARRNIIIINIKIYIGIRNIPGNFNKIGFRNIIIKY